MNKIFTILYYECKLQFGKIATWGVLLAATALTMVDAFPSAGNLRRLEFLTEPAYFVCRAMSIDGLVLVFGLLFLLSDRFAVDKKTGVKNLIMSEPVRKGQYIAGKLLGGFCYTWGMLCAFLVLNTGIYAVALPVRVSAMDCLVPLVKTILVSGIPVSLFVGCTAVALPVFMDVRVFYLLASVLFIVNAGTVGAAGQMPFYLITAGDLIKLVWQHPRWPFVNAGSVQANLLFLIGTGAGACVLLLLKRRFWRAE